MPFQPGQSGNRAGKRKGTRNKVTLAVEALLDGETLTRKAIELAKAGEFVGEVSTHFLENTSSCKFLWCRHPSRDQ